MNRLECKNAFSLLELVVAIALSVVLFTLTAVVFIRGGHYASEQERYTIGMNIARDQFAYLKLLPPEKLENSPEIPIYFSSDDYADMNFTGTIILKETPFGLGLRQADVTVKWLSGEKQPRRIELSRLIRTR